MIKFELPDAEGCLRLWQVLSKQFQVDLSEELMRDLVDAFGNIGGRDIKGLCKLVGKYAKKRQVPYTVDLFRRCGQFKGLV